MFGYEEGLIAIDEIAETGEVDFIRRPFSRKGQANAMKRKWMTVADSGKGRVARAAITHVVFGMDLEPHTNRRVADRIGIVLRLQAESGGWRDAHRTTSSA
jgi:hypothetical protein